MHTSIFQCDDATFGIDATLLETSLPSCVIGLRDSGFNSLDIHMRSPQDLIRLGEEIARHGRLLAVQLENHEAAVCR